MRVFNITENQYKVIYKNILTEISDIATKSNITVTSLQDFKNLVSKLGINDINVENYVGKYCFIEVGSSLSRLQAEIPLIPDINDENGKPYDGQSLYDKGQWYFQNEHKNVLKLTFDDNQTFNNKMPSKDGFDGKTPATAVKLSPHETKSGKSKTFYFANGEDFTDEKAHRLKRFVDDNLSYNQDVKFIIHCMQGRSRSAAIGIYISNKIKQFTDEMLSEYDKEDNNSQFNIGMSSKKTPKYPHKNVMTKMGNIEGWNDVKDKDTKQQWFYNTLINHPNTGFNSKYNNQLKQNKISNENKIFKVNEKQYKFLTEDVFISDLDYWSDTANLSYNKNNGGRNSGNKSSADMLKTDKMDTNNGDTYEVTLKGGIKSYNITSIKGTEVMHYFKNYFDNKDTTININNNDYTLEMEDKEFQDFMKQFTTKVNNVITYCVNGFKQQNPKVEFSKVSIYPVPSSSNFNSEMAKRMVGYSFAGINETQVINQSLLKKDLKNLQKDEDFIEKNKEYYNNNASTQPDKMPGTYNQWVDRDLTKLKTANSENINNLIDQLNNITSKIVQRVQTLDKAKKYGWNDKDLTQYYIEWTNCYNTIKNDLHYFDNVKNKEVKVLMSTITDIDSTKDVSFKEKRWYDNLGNYVYCRIKDNLRGQKDNNGKAFKPYDIQYLKKLPFQIKTMSNGVRMGLKNYYTANNDIVKQEMEKIRNSVFVIFDDNISGGATLSDICLQCKNLGIEYIIPITFGQMAKKEIYGRIPLNTSDNWNF